MDRPARHLWRRSVMLGIAVALGAVLLPAPAATRHQQAAAVASFPAAVIHVVDGDTIDVRVTSTGERVRIRVHGIDAPERGEPFSQVALRFTRATVFGRTVVIEGRDVDAYGRLVGRVRVGDVDLSEALLRAGLACHYRRYSDDPVLERAEREARAAGRGFWASGASQPRCVAREREAASTPRTAPSLQSDGAGRNRAADRPAPLADSQAVLTQRGFIGNTRSRVYHAPTCRNATCANCTRRFDSPAEAEAAGYRPAGDCLGRRK